MTVELGRLRIRCRAAYADQARALRVRARLARLAAERLPAALDRALAPLPSGASLRLERLVVPLPFDPDDYDDETVAVLWADRIRLALAGCLTAVPARDGGSPRAVEARSPSPDAEEVLGRLVRMSPEALAMVARSLLAAEPGTLTKLWQVLGPAGRAVVLAALRRPAARDPWQPAFGWPHALAGPGGPSRALPGTDRQDRDTGMAASAREPDTWVAAWHETAGRAADAQPAGDPSAETITAALRRLAVRQSAAPVATDAAGPRPSLAGGLVLLYPWLGEYLEGTAAAFPDAAPIDVRCAALATLADPGSCADLAADPLVTCLAGAPDGWSVAPVDLPVGTGTWVLAAFAGALDGFQRSTPGFVRAHFIDRPAWLEREPDGDVTVRLARMPLDLVLDRLPFPLGPMRLPWTPVVRIAFQEA
ncbi:contractile injection system tape measure protein [Nonomuraea bangladeshensis]|uniref:contractile injection system tape measure protein n=1 Tax=Nonomuraea bangladeshensis TaxID=404385 RepID=UPI003C2EEEDB